MERIRITREQEEALKDFQKYGTGFKNFVERDFNYTDIFAPLNDFTPEQFALLLCGWYEVEQSFKVGDWVKLINSEDYSKVMNEHFDNSWGWYEKVTEPWKIMLLELGRDKPEFKVGDCCITRSTGTYTYTCRDKGGIAHFEGLFKNDSVKYFYPVESRIEVKGNVSTE